MKKKRERTNKQHNEKGDVTANSINVTDTMRPFKQLFTNTFENLEGTKRILRKIKHMKTDTRKNRKSE